MIEKDWVLENIANPTYDTEDLVILGNINTDNTQFMSKDYYLSSDFIKNTFSDEEGNFLENDFNNFYNNLTQKWNELQDGSFPKGLELDPFDTAASRNKDRVSSLKISLSENYNPNRVQIGVEGFMTVSDPTKSVREIAQSENIFDTRNNEIKQETPEDYALFENPIKWIKSLFDDPLVLATYDEDTIDEFGIHKKGEYKLNERGTYYYETLGDRSPIGKEILSLGDILTKEGSALNAVDFFDSDDLEKSIPGVVFKNLALIAPMFTAAAPYYYTALIAKELTKTMPMLLNMVLNLYGEETELPDFVNRISAFGEQLTLSTSDYARKNTFSAENIINLASEIALQWGTQKQVVKAVSYFGGKPKIQLERAKEKAFEYYKNKKNIESLKGLAAVDDAQWETSILGQRALKKFYQPIQEQMVSKQKIGGDIALAYMALISNTDVYNTMLEKGATAKEAAWVSLGSTLGMYGVDKFLHLGEIFYDNATGDVIRESRKVFKDEISKIVKAHSYGSSTSKPMNFIKQGIAFGKKAANTFAENLENRSLGFAGKAFGEGLEEVTEEAVTDISKGFYSLLGDLGLYEASVENPIDWNTALERYGMSFIGGTLGGGLFYGIDKYKGYNEYRD